MTYCPQCGEPVNRGGRLHVCPTLGEINARAALARAASRGSGIYCPSDEEEREWRRGITQEVNDGE